MNRLMLVIFVITTSCKPEKAPDFKPIIEQKAMDLDLPKPTAHQYLDRKEESSFEDELKDPNEQATTKQPPKEVKMAAKPLISGTQSIAEKIKAEEDSETSLSYIVENEGKKETNPSVKNRNQTMVLQKTVPNKMTNLEKPDFLTMCQEGNYDACHKFAYYESIDGNSKNAERFYRVSCNNGILKSCNNLAYNAELNGNVETAKDYYSRACIKRHPGSCENLKRVLKIH